MGLVFAISCHLPFSSAAIEKSVGWQNGSRLSYQSWGPWLAQRGFVVLAINYRLSKPGQKTYPQAAQDVHAAVQFLRSKAEAFKVDPERVGMMGDSAGGHLVALNALAHNEAPFADAYPNDPYASLAHISRLLTQVSLPSAA